MCFMCDHIHLESLGTAGNGGECDTPSDGCITCILALNQALQPSKVHCIRQS